VNPPDKNRRDEIHKAMSHGLRRGILQALQQAGEPMAPQEVADGLGLGDEVGNVSYHFRVLADLDLVEVADEESVRGALKHFYVLGRFFPPEFRDTLAMDQIAALLGKEAAGLTEGVLAEIVDIIVASGRPIQ
jgi:DNA-binding transcriptional ArsR family regulator